jgi:hypothetical protein
MNRSTRLTLTATLACALIAGTAHAQTAASAPNAAAPQQGLNELDCRTLLRLSGDERDFTLLYLHGFVSGRNNQYLLPVQELATVTDRLIEHCIDRPADKALAVIEQLRKPNR